MNGMKFKQIRKIIRLVWIIGGLGIMAWIILSYQSRGIDPSVLASNGDVAIEYSSLLDRFTPLSTPKSTALIFYPGAMVDSKAYIPLLKQIAAIGYPVYLIHLPYRLAPFPAQVKELFQTTLATIEQETAIPLWVIGGHSKGGALAAQFTHAHPQSVAGLALIATTHPKEARYDLSGFTKPTIKIYATHDGLATLEEIQQFSALLPATTHYLPIEGGNHSQFGYYGRQLGDDPATISRQQQQEQTLDALLQFLNTFDSGS
jgi:pimeloyl-ACP methyl ester carboxylesterase